MTCSRRLQKVTWLGWNFFSDPPDKCLHFVSDLQGDNEMFRAEEQQPEAEP